MREAEGVAPGLVQDAHRALDEVGVREGPLAIRALAAAGAIRRLEEQLSGQPVDR